MFKHNLEDARIGQEILPFEMGYLPELYQKKAEVQLKDCPENRERGLRLMREMAKKDKHFEGLIFDDDFLLQYLRSRKYNINRAFSQLRVAVMLRRKQPSFFMHFNFEKSAISTRKKIVTPLPWRCQDGCAILLVNLNTWDPEEFPIEELKRMIILLLLQSLRDPMNQVNGFKVIFDVKSNPVKHLRFMTPSNIHMLYHGAVECSPGRFKAIHILNESLTFKVAYFLVKPFLSAKIKKRFFFHTKMDDLLNHFPRSVLPTEYGGSLEDYDMTDWLAKVMSKEKLARLGGIEEGIIV